MNLNRQIKRIFGLRREPLPNLEDIMQSNDNSLRYMGYPSLIQVSFALTVQGLEKWQAERTIYFPLKCCVCMGDAQLFLSSYDRKGFLITIKKEININNIPHCHIHGKDNEAKLIPTIVPVNPAVVLIGLIGKNEKFL